MTGSIIREVETKIIKALVREALHAGYHIGVHDGEEMALKPCAKVDTIIGALFSVDEEHLIFYDEEGKKAGWVLLIHGNSGWDVIADHTVNLEKVMGKANKLSEHYSE